MAEFSPWQIRHNILQAAGLPTEPPPQDGTPIDSPRVTTVWGVELTQAEWDSLEPYDEPFGDTWFSYEMLGSSRQNADGGATLFLGFKVFDQWLRADGRYRNEDFGWNAILLMTVAERKALYVRLVEAATSGTAAQGREDASMEENEEWKAASLRNASETERVGALILGLWAAKEPTFHTWINEITDMKDSIQAEI